MNMPITTRVFRSTVRPGMLVRHNGKTWRASANVAKGLYLDSVAMKTRVTTDVVEVLTDSLRLGCQ